MEINDRISQLIGELKLNPNAFAEAVGVKSAIIYNIIKGRRSKPSFDVLQKILIAYNTVNANWLLRGEGDTWEKEPDYALGQGYEQIDNRIHTLIASLKRENKNNPSVEELSELIQIILQENVKQKEKITALYEKQEKILEVIREKLSLDL